MPDTPIYGITYPANTALVTDGATAMQTISTDVELAVQAQQLSTSVTGRNLAENPFFSQTQRPTTATSIADFWSYHVDAIAGVTNTRSNIVPVAGIPEFVTAQMQTAVASNAAGINRYVAIQQTVPNVRATSNGTVVVSFYAKAGSGTPKIGCNVTQTFGTGGVPSADVVVNGQSATISTTWARYSFTFTTASVVGKTFGSNDDDGLIVRIWHSAGSNFNTPSGSVGLQTATIDVSGVQVERTFITPLEYRQPDTDFLKSSDFGVWRSWTPAWRQGAANLSTTIGYARYAIIGKTCIAQCFITTNANGTAANEIRITSGGSLPFPVQNLQNIGGMFLNDLGTGIRIYSATVTASEPFFRFYLDGSTGAATTPTLATNDNGYLHVVYEIA